MKLLCLLNRKYYFIYCKYSEIHHISFDTFHHIFICFYSLFYFLNVRHTDYLLPNKPYALFSCSLYIIKDLNQLFLIIIPVIKKLFNTTCCKRMNKHLFNNLIRNCGNMASRQSRICHMYGTSY